MHNRALVREVILAWLLVVGGSRLCGALPVAFIQDNLALITAVLLLYVPLGGYLIIKQRVDFLDPSLNGLLRAVGLFVVTSLLVFPLYFIGNHFYQAWLGRHFDPHPIPDIWNLLAVQLLLVSLPEEFFFRGYLQGRLNLIWPQRWFFWGTNFGPGLLVTSFVFAISHSLIQYQWWHIFIFFPSLVFGWLRERTGSIIASILFHALSNMVAQWIFYNYP